MYLFKNRSLVFGVLAVLFWATVATAFKIALTHQSPFQLLFTSIFVSLIVLFGFLLLSKKLSLFKTIQKETILWAILLGFLNPYLYYKILFIAYDLLPAQTAQVINFIWPVLIVVFSMIIGEEYFSMQKLGSLSISFFGAFVVITGGSLVNFQSVNGLGAGLAFSSAFVWAFFWLFNKKHRIDPILFLFLVFLFGAGFVSIDALFFQKSMEFSLAQMVTGAYVGIFEMSITFIVWLYALKLAESTALINNFIYVTPFLSLTVIHFVLKENIYPATILGLSLIIMGIVFQIYFHYREKKSKAGLP